MAYASGMGRAFIDRELYCPAVGPRILLAAGPPASLRSRVPDQAAVARVMLERALDAEVPASWVTADEEDVPLAVGLRWASIQILRPHTDSQVEQPWASQGLAWSGDAQ